MPFDGTLFDDIPLYWRGRIVIDTKPNELVGTPCWLWAGRLNRNGYARGWDPETKREPVLHRAIYERLIGAIGDSLVLDHRCRVRRCIRPDHMEPVTVKINTERGDAILFQMTGVTQ